MVSRSQSSSNLKRKRSTGTPSIPIREPQSKKRRTSPQNEQDENSEQQSSVYDFNSDESDTEVPKKSKKHSSKLETLGKAKTNGVKKVNGSSSSQRAGNATAKRKRKSPTPSLTDEEIGQILQKSTEQTKSKSLKKGTVVKGSPTPIHITPVKKSVVQKIEESGFKTKKAEKEIKNETPEKTQKRVSDTVLNEKVSANAVQTNFTSSREKRPSAQAFAAVKTEVLGKLCSRAPIPLVGKAIEAADEIHNIMSRAIDGESNSVLLLGGPGSCKSTIVNNALSRLKEEHPEEGKFYTIRLDGQIQTDDKVALKEIARQLALEMNVEMEKMSFSDTLTTLLYTLSHPTEVGETQENAISTSVIFILDYFDEFLSHPRQALLYNLFDIAQSRKAPIAVICLGRQINAIDSLEKRVKSRFGGRIVQVSKAQKREEFWDICVSALSVEKDSGFGKVWNRYVQELGKDKSIKEICDEIFAESRDVREFFNRSIPVINSLQHNGTFIPSASLWLDQPLPPPELKLCLIQGLSQLELALLICATRLETFHARESFNFNMVYEVYSSLVSRSRIHFSSVTALGQPTILPGGAIQLWGRDVAIRAWERLGEIGLWTSASGEGRGKFVRCEVGLTEVMGICERGKLLTSAMRGWFKEGI